MTLRIDFQSKCLFVFCWAEVSLFTEMDIADIKMINYSLSFNPWLQYLTNKLCSKSNVMIIRIFFNTIETYIIFNLQLHFDNKSLFSLLFFLPGSQIKTRTGGRVYEVFCDVRQLCHPLETSKNYVL